MTVCEFCGKDYARVKTHQNACPEKKLKEKEKIDELNRQRDDALMREQTMKQMFEYQANENARQIAILHHHMDVAMLEFENNILRPLVALPTPKSYQEVNHIVRLLRTAIAKDSKVNAICYAVNEMAETGIVPQINGFDYDIFAPRMQMMFHRIYDIFTDFITRGCAADAKRYIEGQMNGKIKYLT